MASPDATAALDTGTIIYKKMTKAELKVAGLAEDPIFEYAMTRLLPLFEAKAQEPDSSGKLIHYVKGELFDLIATDLDLAAKGYNLGAFKNTLYSTLKNNRNQLPKKKSASTTKPNKATNSTTKPSKGRCALDEFRDRHKDEFKARADNELLGVERTAQDGKWLAAFNRILNDEWSAATDEEKAKMVALAEGKKAERAAGPTAEHIAVTQANAEDDLYKALKAHIGNDWGQIGNAAFFLRGAYTNATGDVKRFFITVGPEDNTPPFLSSDEEKLAFARWAKKVLKPSAPAAQVKKLTDVMLPDLDVDAESPDTLKEMLRGLAVKPDTGAEHPVWIVIEGKFKVDLDAATDEQVREYCRHFLQIQKQGGSGQVTTTPLPAAGPLARAGDNVVPPPPPVGPLVPAGDNVAPPPPPAGPLAPAGDDLVPPPPPAGPLAPAGDNVVPPPPPAGPLAPAGDDLVPPPPPAGPLAPAGDNVVPPPPPAGPLAPAGDDLVPPPPPAGPLAPAGDNVVPPPPPAGPLAAVGDDLVPPPPPAGPLAPAGDNVVPPPPPAGPFVAGGEDVVPPPSAPLKKRGRPPGKNAKGKGKNKGKKAEDGGGAQEGNDENEEPAPPKPAKRRRVAPTINADAPPPSPRRLRDVRVRSRKVVETA
ncbi:hypothetical protein B0H10DRAFT_2233274 [Mycena sp. CBHHK59/15]|nr:hypothetical protein B0H10DRAFT_2233274 [Mycena sp. CBHHK59/15]